MQVHTNFTRLDELSHYNVVGGSKCARKNFEEWKFRTVPAGATGWRTGRHGCRHKGVARPYNAVTWEAVTANARAIGCELVNWRWLLLRWKHTK